MVIELPGGCAQTQVNGSLPQFLIRWGLLICISNVFPEDRPVRILQRASGHIWRHSGLLLLGGRWVLLAPRGQRPGMLLSILSGSPATKKCVSLMSWSRSPALPPSPLQEVFRMMSSVSPSGSQQAPVVVFRPPLLPSRNSLRAQSAPGPLPSAGPSDECPWLPAALPGPPPSLRWRRRPVLHLEHACISLHSFRWSRARFPAFSRTCTPLKPICRNHTPCF